MRHFVGLKGMRVCHVALGVTAILAFGGCGTAEDIHREQRQNSMNKTIEQVQEEYTQAWMAIPGVVGTAIGQCEGEPCILILTASNMEQIRRQIPASIEGYPVTVQYVGEIRALDEP